MTRASSERSRSEAPAVVDSQPADLEALVEIVRESRPRLRAAIFLAGRGMSQRDREAATRYALVEIVDSAADLTSDVPPGDWMHDIASRIAAERADGLDMRRDDTLHAFIRRDPRRPDDHRELDAGDVILQMLDRLPDVYRSTFALLYLEGLSDEECAARERVSVATVTHRVNRIRRLVRRIIGGA